VLSDRAFRLGASLQREHLPGPPFQARKALSPVGCIANAAAEQNAASINMVPLSAQDLYLPAGQTLFSIDHYRTQPNESK